MTGHPSNTGDEVEVAHEALIRHWPRLREWLDQDRSALLLRDSVRAAAHDWEHSGHDESYLVHRGRRLEDVETLRHHPRLEFNAEEQAYIDSNLVLHERSQRRQRNIVTGIVAASIAVAAVFLFLGVNAIRAQQEAERQARISLIQALAGQASLQAELDDRQLGALLARQSYLFDRASDGSASALVDEGFRGVFDTAHFDTVIGGQKGWISSVAFSADGKFIAAGGCSDRVNSDGGLSCNGGEVWLLNADDPAAAADTFPGPPTGVSSVALSPDGGKLAVAGCLWQERFRCSQREVRLWNLSDRSSIILLKSDEVASIAFSADGQNLAGSSGAHVLLWDTSQPSRAPRVLVAARGGVRNVAFSPSGRVLAAAGCATRAPLAQNCTSGEILIWDLIQSEADPFVLRRDGPELRAVAFDPTGERVAAISGDFGKVLVWDYQQPNAAPVEMPPVRQGSTPDYLTSLAFSPDGKVLAVGASDPGRGGNVALLNTERPGDPPTFITRQTGRISSVAFSPDGQLLASGGEDPAKVLRLWQMEQLGAPEVLRGEGYIGINAVAFSVDDGLIGSTDDAGTVRLWNTDDLTATPQVPIRGANGYSPSGALAFSPDGTYLAAAGGTGETAMVPNDWGRAIRLQDLSAPTIPPLVLRGHQDRVTSLAFSKTRDILASGSSDATVRIWDVRRPAAEPVVLGIDDEGITSVAFGPDGRTLATGGDNGTIRLWDIDRPNDRPISVRLREGLLTQVVISPDGRSLASGETDGSILLWDINQLDATPVALSGHKGLVRSVAFNPEGTLLAAGGDDGTIRIWDLQRLGAAPTVLRGHEDVVASLSFSLDGQRLASASWDGTVRLWTASTEALANMVCQLVVRNLTMEEWLQFVGPDVPYESTCSTLPSGNASPQNMASPEPASVDSSRLRFRQLVA